MQLSLCPLRYVSRFLVDYSASLEDLPLHQQLTTYNTHTSFIFSENKVVIYDITHIIVATAASMHYLAHSQETKEV